MTGTWDDALTVVQNIVDQLMHLDPPDAESETSLGLVKSGALIVLGALLVPRSGEGSGAHSIHDLISLGALDLGIELEGDDDARHRLDG